MATLKQTFSRMSKREQVMVTTAAVILVIAALFLLVLAPFYSAIDKRSERVIRKSEDLAWMHSVAPELQAAPQVAGAPMGNPGESLVVLVDRTARDTGLSNSLTGQTPNGPNSIRVRFEGAAFDTLVMWMGQLVQQHGVHIDQVSLDRTGEPGLVNASFVLNRASA